MGVKFYWKVIKFQSKFRIDPESTGCVTIGLLGLRVEAPHIILSESEFSGFEDSKQIKS